MLSSLQSDFSYIPLDYPEGNRRRKHVSNCMLLFIAIFTTSLSFNLWIMYSLTHRLTIKTLHGTTPLNPDLLPSPAQDSIKNEVVKYTRGLGGDIPIYEQPPSVEVDKAWEGLYEYAMSKVNKEELSSVVNETWPIREESGFYFVALDVFHQLHCLDMLRQAVHPTHYVDFHLPPSHLRHCIGAIRQSLMCSSDISPIVWQWSEEKKKAIQRDDIVHTCRNFENIKEWAMDHHYEGTPDFTRQL